MTEEQKEIINNLPHLKPDFSLLEKEILFGKITNICSDYNGKDDRYGDFGQDYEGNLFCYTSVGWLPQNRNVYEAKYWKKEYEKLSQLIENQPKK